MKIKHIIIKNFKSYKEEHISDFKDFNFIIGKNGDGKSNLFEGYNFTYFNSFKNSNSFCLVR